MGRWRFIWGLYFEIFAVFQCWNYLLYPRWTLGWFLYISSLFSSDSFDFLPMIQYIRWSCNPSCFLLVNTCFCHVSLRSRWMLKYLAVSLFGICCPFKITAGQVSRFKEKVIWVDLFSLAFMRHCFNHVSNWFRWCWRFIEAVMGFW